MPSLATAHAVSVILPAMRSGFLGVVAIVYLALPAAAEVVRVDVSKRVDVGTSGYEKIVGTIHFAVDPANPRNAVIVDLDKARHNSHGQVEFSADLYILRPKNATVSNGVALIEVSNRGRKGLLSGFSRARPSLDPSTDADLGDGFLTKQGYTLVWVGWQFDVSGADSMKFIAPIATGVSALVTAEVTPNAPATEATFGDLASYAPVDPSSGDTTLTVRDSPFGAETPVARANWQLRGNTVTMADGFEPGRIYQLTYRAMDLPVVGAGFAAFRDTASWLKHDPAALTPIRYAYTFGSSQSGRFLRTFLYQGFNTDERGRQVFDGVMAHIAGGARLSLNVRGAAPNASSAYNVTNFPFANVATRDPIEGVTEGLLHNSRARDNQPKIFFTNSAVEYWNSRAAALIHTTPDGKTDLAPPDNARIYFLAGTQHSPAPFPARLTTGQQPVNPVQYWWTLRALLTAMDGWIRNGKTPPPSQYPKLSDGSLVPLEALSFPSIPGVQSPRVIKGSQQGSVKLPQLLPQVDSDGNEVAGVRSVEQAVPVATYTGWNFRSPKVGNSKELVSLTGSSIAFPTTTAERQHTKDPRRAIEERYTSKEQYLTLARAHADKLVSDGYLLASDVPLVLERMDELWAESHKTDRP